MARLSLSDADEIDRLLRTTYHWGKKLYVPLSEPGVYFKLSHGLGQWVLKDWLLNGDDLIVGYWPGVTEERAVAAARRMKEARAARENPSPPPRPLRDLLQKYDERLKSRRSGETMRRSLHHALRGLEERDVANLTTAELQERLDLIAAQAPKHANRCLAYVNAFFRWAVKNQGLASNPAAAIPKYLTEKRQGRALTIDEIAEIWSAAEVLPRPGREAVRLLILLPVPRKLLEQLCYDRLRLIGDTPHWSRSNPKVRGREQAMLWWKLSPQANAQIAEVADSAPYEERWFATLSAAEPGLTWASCKIRLSQEIARRRKLEERRPQEPWNFDDFPRSFAAIEATMMRSAPELIARCQDKLDPFSSPAAIDWALSQDCADQASDLLWHWGILVAAITTRS